MKKKEKNNDLQIVSEVIASAKELMNKLIFMSGCLYEVVQELKNVREELIKKEEKKKKK